VTLARASGTLSFPANFTLIAAMNPCPCGYLGDPMRECRCQASAIQRYQKRISGPLLDRIDIHIEVPRVEYEKLAEKRGGESSATVRERVTAARRVQEQRYVGSGLHTNADMGPKELSRYVVLDESAEGMMKAAVKQLQLSARGYHRVLKLSRTIADIGGEERVQVQHIAEALQYRSRQLTA
jgi:magnesium chelatase family protein